MPLVGQRVPLVTAECGVAWRKSPPVGQASGTVQILCDAATDMPDTYKGDGLEKRTGVCRRVR